MGSQGIAGQRPGRESLLAFIHAAIKSSTFIDFFLNRPVSEEVLGDCVYSLLKRQGYRTALRVNLRKLAHPPPADSRKAVSVLKSYRHPLQPDVDIVVEDSNAELWGHELKLIRWAKEPLKPVTPRSHFYDGLDQALALATCGVDYACLWHAFIVPMEAYRKLEARNAENAEQVDDDRVEFGIAYMQITNGLLERFQLPIGYIALVIVGDKAHRSVSIEPLLPWKCPDKLVPTETGARVRALLLKALDICT